jgi:hypothetical protein
MPSWVAFRRDRLFREWKELKMDNIAPIFGTIANKLGLEIKLHSTAARPKTHQGSRRLAKM